MKDRINILLADDDKDDCLFFKEAIEELAYDASLIMVHNGEQLMQNLESSNENLPDVIFLDLNMPRKNGFECLIEIKNHQTFKSYPIVIVSTSYDEEKSTLLYNTGASCYICKPADFEEWKDLIHKAITIVTQSHSTLQPTKENFYINEIKVGL